MDRFLVSKHANELKALKTVPRRMSNADNTLRTNLSLDDASSANSGGNIDTSTSLSPDSGVNDNTGEEGLFKSPCCRLLKMK